MPDRLIWYKDNLAPSISDVVAVDGAPFDLVQNSSTVAFRMRALGSASLTTDATATVLQTGSESSPPIVNKGQVAYNWQAADVDTTGEYLVWWRVTTLGKTQDVGEAIIEIRDHAPATGVYVELEELKETLTLQGETYADGDIAKALAAASRAIDGHEDTRFYKSEETRYYTPTSARGELPIDDLVNLGTIASPGTTIAIDTNGDGTYETTWTQGTDFYLDPQNANLDGLPFSAVTLRAEAGRSFPTRQRSVKIVGVFGWPAVPDLVREATSILAHRWLRRKRDAPFGVIAVGIDTGATIRLARTDPDVAFMLDNIRGRVPRVIA